MVKPGELFADLWMRLEPMAGAIIETPWQGLGATEFAALSCLLHTEESEEVPAAIYAYLDGTAMTFGCSVDHPDERAFVVMCALDAAAMFIHPGEASRIPRRSTVLSPMLQAMKAARTETGCYAHIENVGMVVPKGRLMARKGANDQFNDNGTEICLNFTYLSLLKPLQGGRRLRMIVAPPRHCQIPAERARHVGLAPIAEDRHDLSFTTQSRGTAPASRAYLDTEPVEPILTERITQTVTAMVEGGAGLIVLPEGVTSSVALEALKSSLQARQAGGPQALILTGTGPSPEKNAYGRSYNETTLITAQGRVLLRQRKLHHFKMSPARMAQCGIDREKGFEGHPHTENIAVGEELVICDVLGLGRVMTLICENGGGIVVHGSGGITPLRAA